MFADRSGEPWPDLAHTVIAADAQRLERLATLHSAMVDHALDGGPSSPTADAALGALVALLDDWKIADHAAELRDMVHFTAAEVDCIAAAARGILGVDSWLLEDKGPDVIAGLERARAGDVGPVPRVWAHRAMRSAKRFHRLVELDGPEIIKASESGILAGALDVWRTAPEPTQDLDWGWAGGLLHEGLMLALVADDDDCYADLGLGRSATVLPIVGLRRHRLDRVDSPVIARGPGRALEAQVPAVAHPALVPQGRFHAHGPDMGLVCDHFEETGPIGWAVGPELDDFVERFAALRSRRPGRARALRAAEARLRAAAVAGQGVVGFLELMHAEGEGSRVLPMADASEPG